MTHVVPDCACPTCHKVADRATAVDGNQKAPEPGDITVCLGCGEALSFGPGLSLGKLRWEDLDQATASLVMMAQNAVLDMKGPH